MRVTTTVVIFFILLNAFVGVIGQAGLDDSWGTQPQTGEPDALTQAQQESDRVQPSGGGLSTLFGLIVSLGSSLGTIFGAALPAVSMFADLGVPTWFLGYATAPLAIIAAVEIADFLRGIG